MSFLPYLRNVPTQRKILVRMQMQQIVSEEEEVAFQKRNSDTETGSGSDL
jgi:hypothetical protein